MKHIVIYVPGLGDSSVRGRRLLVASWWLYGVRPVVHQMNWADGESFASKLTHLLDHIDTLTNQGKRVSLVGESAGASAVIIAYAQRQTTVHRVVCICGKLNSPATISTKTYAHNTAFAESMASLPESLKTLTVNSLARIRSVHPLEDPVVPVSDTFIAGVESKTIPTRGHSTGIIVGDLFFSPVILLFLKRH